MLTFEKLKPGAVLGEHPFWLTDDAAVMAFGVAPMQPAAIDVEALIA
jgi:hypothetical protein